MTAADLAAGGAVSAAAVVGAGKTVMDVPVEGVDVADAVVIVAAGVMTVARRRRTAGALVVNVAATGPNENTSRRNDTDNQGVD